MKMAVHLKLNPAKLEQENVFRKNKLSYDSNLFPLQNIRTRFSENAVQVKLLLMNLISYFKTHEPSMLQH